MVSKRHDLSGILARIFEARKYGGVDVFGPMGVLQRTADFLGASCPRPGGEATSQFPRPGGELSPVLVWGLPIDCGTILV